jgi:hypothetical protein
MLDGCVPSQNKDGYYLGVWAVRAETTPPAPLWETGQTACYDLTGIVIDCTGTRQDGELKTGVSWPHPRFSVWGDCVIDNLTSLMWSKNGNLPNGTLTWQGALDYVASINNGLGLCGHHGWRLPNRKELLSLIDYSQNDPALPVNHPFNNVQSNFYWSSTSYAMFPSIAWIVDMESGYLSYYYKDKDNTNFYVWPVSSGQIEPLSILIYLPMIMR